jgi:hypothetical protein
MKKYATVKIKDPGTEGHTVRLMPLQSFDLVCTKHDPEDDFNIKVLSDFLTVTDILSDSTKVVFKIAQKCDLNEWSKISTFFLGNVLLSKKLRSGDSKIHLCVYCQPTNQMKANVLTVINPEGSLLKVEPNQLLHIVMFDRSEKTRWSLEKLEGFTCVRCETVVNDFTKVYDPDSLFCPEPRSLLLPMNEQLKNHPIQYFANEVMGSGGLVTEYHFWLCLSPSEIGKIHSLANGSYAMSAIKIKGEQRDKVIFQNLNLTLSLRGARKIDLDYFQSVHTMAKCWNERSLSYVRHSLFNPNFGENIDVSDSDGWFYLELPHPSTYFNGFDITTFWFCENKIDYTIRSGISCHELHTRYVNGIEVQRFLITNVSSGVVNDRLINTGVLKFRSIGTTNSKTLSLSFWKIPSDGTRDMVPIDNRKKSFGFRYEVELELKTGEVTDCATVTPLYMIDPEPDYSEFFSEGYLESLMSGSNKKTPMMLPLIKNSTTMMSAFSLGQGWTTES